MTIRPEDIQGGTDVARKVSEESPDADFELLVGQRRELLRQAIAVAEAISFVETEMLRQVEKHAKTIAGVTYARGQHTAKVNNHELVLDRAWRKALWDATNHENGAVDWDLAGQAMREIVGSLYLSPSSWVKAGGLRFLGIERSEIESETVKGYKLIVIGDGE